MRTMVLGGMFALAACAEPAGANLVPETGAEGDTAGTGGSDTEETVDSGGDTSAGETAGGDTSGGDTSGEDTGAAGECPAQSDRHYAYTEYLIESQDCGDADLVLGLVTAFGFATGYTLSEVVPASFLMDYDGMSLLPLCLVSDDCTYACPGGSDVANLSSFGFEADFGYSIESEGSLDGPGLMSGRHGVDVSCVGTEVQCAELAGALGLAMPCHVEFGWGATIEG